MNNLSAEDFYCQYKMCKSQLDKIMCNGCLAKDYFTNHSCSRFKELYKADAIYTLFNLYNVKLAKSEYEKLRSWIDELESSQIHNFKNKLISDIFK